MKKALLGLGFVAVIVIAAIVVPGMFGNKRSASAFDDALFEARRGTLSVSVIENGYLKAKNSLNVKPRFERMATITWIIDEGKTVEKGDLLVEFDGSELRQQLDEGENRLIQYETELEAAEAELEIQGRDNISELEKAELAVEIAKQKLERYDLGDAPLELRRKQLSLEKANGNYRRAKVRLAQVPDLLKEGFLTQEQAQEEEIQTSEAEIEKVTAEKDLELYKKYAHPMELAKLRSEVREAERSVERSKERAQISLKGKQAKVTQQQRQVTSTKARVEKMTKQMEYMTLKAPGPGIVHYGDPARPWRREEIKIGNNFGRGNTIITLPDLAQMQVMVSVHEADINQVDVGQKVHVTLDTHKGRIFKGEVTKIASVATSNGWGGGRNNKRFSVEIDMEETELSLRAGITAKTEILIDELEDVLHVPIHAVHAEGDEYFCFTVVGGTPDRTTVEIGRSNAHYVEILAGLSGGESVLLYDPRDAGVVEDGEDDEASGDSETPAAAMRTGG